MSEITQAACPVCLTANRVSSARLGDEPKCGNCGTLLFPGAPIDLDDAGFDKFICRTDFPVLVDFWAPWCGPCRAMAPHFERAAARLKGKVQFVKVNTEQSPALAMRLSIRAIPTLVFYQDGTEIKRASGALDTGELVKWAA